MKYINKQAIDKHAGPETRDAILGLMSEIKMLQDKVDRLITGVTITQVSQIAEGPVLPSPIPQQAELFLLRAGKNGKDKLCWTGNNSSNVWRWNEASRTK